MIVAIDIFLFTLICCLVIHSIYRHFTVNYEIDLLKQRLEKISGDTLRNVYDIKKLQFDVEETYHGADCE
jgi:hypothetical protein